MTCVSPFQDRSSGSPATARPSATSAALKRRVNVSLIERPVPGDWVIVHVGFALNRIDPEEAQRTLAALKAAGLHDEEHAS